MGMTFALFESRRGATNRSEWRRDPVQKSISTGFFQSCCAPVRIGRTTTLGVFMPHTLALLGAFQSWHLYLVQHASAAAD